MKFNEIASEVLKAVGGVDNVIDVIRCQSRLRVSIKDFEYVDEDKVKKIEGVLGTKKSGMVYQIVFGDKVESVFQAFKQLLEFSKNDESTIVEKRKLTPSLIFGTLSETMAGIFTPVGTGLVGSGLVTALAILLKLAGIIQEGDAFSTVLTVIGGAGIAFLPMIVALASAERFKCNKIIAVIIAGILMSSTWTTLLSEGTNQLMLFGVIPLHVINYSTAIIPPILAIWVMAKLERYLKSHLPDILGNFFVPFVEIFVIGLASLIVIGPLAQILSDTIMNCATWMFDKVPLIASAVYAGLYPIMVMTGTHTATFTILFDNLARYGVDNVFPLMALAHAGMATAALVVFFKTKNKKLKGFASSGALVTFIGLAEPALYGVCVPLKKLLLVACVSAGLGGIVYGMFNVTVAGLGYLPLGTFPLYFNDTFIPAMLGLLITIIISAFLSIIWGYKVGDEDKIDIFSQDEDDE